jgi:hypothetical protein
LCGWVGSLQPMLVQGSVRFVHAARMRSALCWLALSQVATWRQGLLCWLHPAQKRHGSERRWQGWCWLRSAALRRAMPVCLVRARAIVGWLALRVDRPTVWAGGCGRAGAAPGRAGRRCGLGMQAMRTARQPLWSRLPALAGGHQTTTFGVPACVAHCHALCLAQACSAGWSQAAALMRWAEWPTLALVWAAVVKAPPRGRLLGDAC